MEEINEDFDEETLDDIQGIRFEEEIEAGSVGLFTFRKSPPLCLSGDVVAFRNPEQCKEDIKIARLVGMGGQRVSFVGFHLLFFLND